jgi:osmoprotectant transport system ATP-binding protein
MSEPAIELREAGYSLNGTRLIGPLNLQIKRGETLVLLGESGSGKTTTLKLINRLLDPTEGEVVVEGRSTTDWDPVRLRRRIGYVIQEVGLLPHLSVAGNVGLVPRLEKWSPQRRRDRVEELLRLVGLPPGEFSGRRPHELSGGQRQRVGVARALAVDPPILLCDEAFGAVDPVTRAGLQSEFKLLADALSKTVVFVTHDVREALALATRIAVFTHGVVPFIGTVDEFKTDDTAAVAALRGLQ